MVLCAWCIVLAAMAIIILILMTTPAKGEEDPLHVGHTHQGDAGKFYQSWHRPDYRDQSGKRYQSCCGQQDCRPILEMRKHPGSRLWIPQVADYVPATWEVLISVPYDGRPQWVAVPDKLWEDNQPDPRESPDERGHVCVIYSGYIICAVRASGQ